MPSPRPDIPAQGFARILQVAETVAEHGPVRLEQVMARTGLPRSAAYRCLKELEAQGWTRRILSGAGYVLTSATHARFSPRQRVSPHIEQLVQTLGPLAKTARIDADIAVLRDMAEITICETTRATDPRALQEPFFASPLTLAALLVTGTDDRLAHVRTGLSTASPEERSDVTSGRFTRQLSETAKTGHVWDTISQSLCFPFVDSDGSAGAVRLEGNGSSPRSVRKLESLMRDLKQALPSIVPEVTQVQRAFWPALVNR